MRFIRAFRPSRIARRKNRTLDLLFLSIVFCILFASLAACTPEQQSTQEVEEVTEEAEEVVETVETAIPSCTDAPSLSPLAQEVFDKIRASSVLENSPVPENLLLTTCNSFEKVLVDGPEIFGAMRDEIATAKHEVDLTFFLWDHRSDGADLIGEGLKNAEKSLSQDERLLVRILVNDTQVPWIDGRPINELFDSVKAWGLDESKIFLQLATYPHSALGALHEKFLIVDGRSLIVTGANPERQHDDKPTRWRDTGYLIQGRVARSALASFDEAWNNHAKHWDCTNRLLEDCQATIRFKPQRTWLVNDLETTGTTSILAVGRKAKGPPNNDVSNPQDNAWLTVMEHAKTSIHIQTPNVNDDAFQDALVNAVGRGVVVRLVTGLGFNGSSKPGQGGTNQEVLAKLRRRILKQHPDMIRNFLACWHSADGLTPAVIGKPENPRNATHAKFMSVDGTVAIVGSGNMDTQSWNNSREFNILIDDPSIVSRIEKAFFDKDFENSICEVVDLFEDTDAKGDPVCSLWAVPTYKREFTKYELCKNDEAKSAIVYNIPANTSIRLFDDSNGSRDDDWAEIFANRDIQTKKIPTFEKSFLSDDIRVLAFYRDNLDGKVSRFEVTNQPVVLTGLPYGEACLDNTVFPLAVGEIIFYEDSGFRSQWTRVLFDQNIEDFDEIFRCDGGWGFGDKTSSVRYYTPPNWQFRLFDDDHFSDRSVVLQGMGSRNLDNFNNKASSGRWEKIEINSIDEAFVELYDDTGYKDRHLRIERATNASVLRDFHHIHSTDGNRGFNDKASSARWQIPVGWRFVLYDDTRFRDRRFILEGSGYVEHSRLIDFNDKASSGRWEQVQEYRTSDGCLYRNKAVADAHQAELDGDSVWLEAHGYVKTNHHYSDEQCYPLHEWEPADRDTDNDGLSDYFESNFYTLDPNDPDIDGDGLLDGYELEIGTYFDNTDSDFDGLDDKTEDDWWRSLSSDEQTQALSSGLGCGSVNYYGHQTPAHAAACKNIFPPSK